MDNWLYSGKKSHSGFREDRSFWASSGIGFELSENRLENLPLFINEVAQGT